MMPSIIAAARRIQKPIYSIVASGVAASLPGVDAGVGFSSTAVKLEPQLAQKRASVGLSYPQLLHLIDAITASVYGLKLHRPVDIPGGDRVTIGRTFELIFSLTI